MNLHEPLESLGNELKIPESKQWRKDLGGKDAWDEFWGTFRKAKQGDVNDFIELINELKASFPNRALSR